MKILVVNEKSSFSEIIRDAIQNVSDKIICDIVNTTEEALKKREEEDYDLLIVEFEMFNNNLKLLEKISKDKKVVILSDNENSAKRESLFSIEINLVDYIIKSDSTFIDYLSKIINRLLRNDYINLLFVGNNIVLRDRIEKILEIQNYTFCSATDHVEALEVLEREHIDLILCDYDILEEEGVFFVQVLREKYSMEDLPIVIMSNFNKDVNIERYLKAGANDYIHKPFDKDSLLCRLNLNIENKLLLEKTQSCYLIDNQTGLYSFNFFQESGKKMLNAARRETIPMAVAIIEIDNFSDIVDILKYKSYEVLKHLATIVTTSLRSSDVIGRYSGEKIVVLMTNTPVKNAFLVIDRLRKNIKNLPYIMDNGDEINYTISGGVAGTKDIYDLNILIDKADEYLYRAKRYGMDRVEVDE